LRHGHDHVTRLGATLGDEAAHGVGHFVEFLDLAVRDPALFERLARESLEYQVTGRGLTQLDQLGAGGTDIQPDHGWMRP